MKNLIALFAEKFFNDFRNFAILFLLIINVLVLVTLHKVSQRLTYANQVIIECEESYDSFFDTVAEGDTYNNYMGEQQYSPI